MIETIDNVPMLIRREIEARVLAPFVEALTERFGRDEVVGLLRRTIERIARNQGQSLAAASGENDLPAFGKVTDKWRENGALQLDVLQHTERQFDFNVTRCQYAEMYRRLGIPELGEILSCGRDFVASEGFNANLKLTRTQTILAGADHCDFRYRLEGSAGGVSPEPNSGS
jgi:hypothetical protein